MISKVQLRKEIAEQRRALDRNWIETASASIVERFQTLEAFQSAKTVALYLAIAGEVRLDALLSVCWARGMQTCVPVFNTALNGYEMAAITPETKFERGQLGIREPVAPCPVRMDSIDLMAVPGVAFDRYGNRLGRGGGHYDRLLAGFRGFAAGVAFDFQIRDLIPCEPCDRSVGAVVTESGICEVRNER